MIYEDEKENYDIGDFMDALVDLVTDTEEDEKGGE